MKFKESCKEFKNLIIVLILVQIILILLSYLAMIRPEFGYLRTEITASKNVSLGDNSIQGQKLCDNSVSGEKISTEPGKRIRGANLEDRIIRARHIGINEFIPADHLPEKSITSREIAPDAVKKEHLAYQSVKEDALTPDAAKSMQYRLTLSSDESLREGDVVIARAWRDTAMAIGERSKQTNDMRIIGVVIGEMESRKGLFFVCSQGFCKCKVKAGPQGISQGDYLTTSEIPGCAVKLEAGNAQHGVVIGEAKEAVEPDKEAMIVILVSIHSHG